jgi:RimJ/RimL family protein N-acetyltransferase
MATETLPLTSRRVRLEPLAPRHLDEVHTFVNRPAMIGHWPVEGRDVPRERLAEVLWQLSPLQYAVLRKDQGAVIGLVQGLDVDQRSRTIGLGLAMDPQLWHRGWPLEAVILFLDLLFDVMGYRKVYVQMSASTARRIGSAAGEWLTREVTFEQHKPMPGAPNGSAVHEDWHVFSLFRERWDAGLLELVGGRRMTSDKQPGGDGP